MTDNVTRLAALLHDTLCSFEEHYYPHTLGGATPEQTFWTPCHPENAARLDAAGVTAGLHSCANHDESLDEAYRRGFADGYD